MAAWELAHKAVHIISCIWRSAISEGLAQRAEKQRSCGSAIKAKMLPLKRAYQLKDLQKRRTIGKIGEAETRNLSA